MKKSLPLIALITFFTSGIHKALAQFGEIRNPYTVGYMAVSSYGSSQSGSALIIILGNLIKFAIVVAGIYTFWNLISAGFMFLGAGGEAKNITKAWEKIWQSLVGLLIVAGSFVLALIFGYLIFGSTNATILINPRIFGPT